MSKRLLVMSAGLVLTCATSCGDNTAPPGGAATPDPDSDSLAVGATVLDPEGRKWVSRGPIKYAPLPASPERVFPAHGGNPRRLADLPIEQVAKNIRPLVDIGGVELELSEADTMVLAQTIKQADASSVSREQAGSEGEAEPAGSEGDTVTIRSAQVVGGDERQNFNASASDHFNMKTAGLYYTPISSSTGWCTCFKAINEHTCLSAGHCLYNPGVGWFPGFNLRFGLAGPSPKPEIPWCHARAVPGGWSSDGDTLYDYGVIILHGRFGASCNTPDYSVGWHNWTEPPHFVNGQVMFFSGHTTGYPVPPPFGWPYPTFTRSAASNNYTNAAWFAYIYHQMDTSGGQSGSPVFNSNGIVMGIHQGWTGSINRAISMNSTKVSWMTSVAGF